MKFCYIAERGMVGEPYVVILEIIVDAECKGIGE